MSAYVCIAYPQHQRYIANKPKTKKISHDRHLVILHSRKNYLKVYISQDLLS
jgi:hypothetical protein